MTPTNPDFFQCIVDHLGDGLWVADENHRIVYANDAMADIAGVPGSALVGRHVLKDFPEGTTAVFQVDYLAAVASLQARTYSCPVLTPAGTPTWQAGWLIPLLDQGRLSAMACTVRDITLQKQQEEQVLVSEQRLEMALDGSGLGFWDWNVSTGETTFSQRWCSMLGYQSDEIEANVGAWERLIHPEDAPIVLAGVQAHMQGETADYESEHRLRHKDGHWVWVLGRGKVMERDAQGRPLRMTGVHLDISHRKQLKSEGADLLRRIAALIGELGDGSRANAPQDRDLFEEAPALQGLTLRQREVLRQVALGRSSAEIARHLQIAPATVTTHRRDLMHKLDLHSTAELTRFAIQHKLIAS